MSLDPEAGWMTPTRRLPAGATRPWRLALLAAVVTALWTGDAQGASPTARTAPAASDRAVATTVLAAPAGQNRSEPHIALDPEHANRLFVVAQGSLPNVSLDPQMFWRSADGGRTWSRPRLMGFIDNTPDGAAGDPVVAAGRGGVVLFGTLAVKIDEAAGTFAMHVGTRVSTDSGRTFPAFGTAQRILAQGEPTESVDKEWLAIDTSVGPFGGRAYLVWVHSRADGSDDLLFSASPDGGRTYGPPQLLQHSIHAEHRGLGENAEVAVRPDGTVDVVWGGFHQGRPVILHAASVDGGASFSAPEPVAALDPRAGLFDVSPWLAVSPRGRLGLCWAQARRKPPGRPRVLCQQTGSAGRWSPARAVLPRGRDRQYLPAAAFQGERLWVAMYVSDAARTRMVAIPGKGRGFGAPVTLNRWPVGSSRICAPHPPACTRRQTFVGDYIGVVATPKQLVVAYIEPVVGAGRRNRVLVSRLATTRQAAINRSRTAHL